ncbi:MAG TPA: TetR/AcrR family transcriptional regulator [Azospirillaceae bacterium]|nr:TetR/AcrR family transcriptional regulator [Azospirillaceae bacterium]
MARGGQGPQAGGAGLTAPGAGTRTTFHHGDLERAALDAALSILEGQGPAALTLRSVAASVGVNHRALYRRFASHEALLLDVAGRGFGMLADRLEQAGALPGASPEGRMARAYAGFALEHPHLYDLMYSLPLKGLFRTEDGAGPALRRLVAGAAAIVAPERPDPGSAEDRALRDRVVRVWGLAHGLVTLYRAGALWARGDADALDYIARAADAMAGQASGAGG